MLMIHKQTGRNTKNNSYQDDWLLPHPLPFTEVGLLTAMEFLWEEEDQSKKEQRATESNKIID